MTTAPGTTPGADASPNWAASSSINVRNRLPPASMRCLDVSVTKASSLSTDERRSFSTAAIPLATSCANRSSTMGRSTTGGADIQDPLSDEQAASSVVGDTEHGLRVEPHSYGNQQRNGDDRDRP